jgi:hypothetical protein
MSHEEWATKVQREVHKHWKESHNDWENGVKVFYSPVHSQTNLLILGFQPGGRGKGKQHSRFDAGNFTPPEEHHYVTENWDLAEEMRGLFDGHEDVLSNSVASNVVFFRAPNTDDWDELDKSRRTSMEDFCWDYVEELVDRVNPEMILTVGLRTFDEVTGRMGLNREAVLSRNNGRLLAVSNESSPKVAGMIHLTGARISNDDKSRLFEQTRELLAENRIIERA